MSIAKITGIAIGLGLFAVGQVVGGGVAAAAESPDQVISCGWAGAGESYAIQNSLIGQTVTVGTSGLLSKVTFPQISNNNWAVADLIVTVRATSGGLPTGPVLATQAVPPGSVPTTPTFGLVEVTFSSPATVTAGDQYAILLAQSGGNRFTIGYVAPSCYDAGSVVYDVPGWLALPQDINLTTYVTTSDPASEVESSAASHVVAFKTPDGASCSSPTESNGTWTANSVTASSGTWVKVPLCTRDGATFLGWSTGATFPVSIAKGVIDHDYGAWDGDVAGERMIFIPRNAQTAVTGDVTLYAIWVQ